MKATRYFLSFYLILSFVAMISGQQTRSERVKKSTPKPPDTLYKGSYALVIGESDYANGWPLLEGVLKDVPEVKAALEKHGFEVEVAMNLKSDALDAAIKAFIGKYGFDYENRLLIYFAGHGHTLKSADSRGELGYIVPVDAPLSDDVITFKQKAIPMDDIQNYAKKIQSKHALFVFDSCFSGKLVSKSVINVPPFIVEYVEKPVRQFITSGSANQTVPDNSVFRELFVRGLDGEADDNRDGFVLGSELGQFLVRELTNRSNRSQIPQYGKMWDGDFDKGDFVFAVDKKANVNLSKVVSEQPQKISTPTGPPPVVRTPPVSNSISKTFGVSSFTQTDVCVEPETTLSITASGTISLGESIKNTDPRGKNTFEFWGVTTPIFSKYYLEKDLPLGALMCRFDYDDKWNYCSVSYTLKAEEKGCLLLEVNDKDKNDNAGEYKVTVRSK